MYGWEQLLRTSIMKKSARMIGIDSMELPIDYPSRLATNRYYP